MDISSRKSMWKLIYGAAGIIIVLVSVIHTNYLYQKLSKLEVNNAEYWEIAYEVVSDFDDEDEDYCDYTLHLKVMESNETIPVILTDENDNVIAGRNFGEEHDQDITYLDQEKEKLKNAGVEPIKGNGSFIYYKNSKILRQLRFFPIIQLLLIAAFITFGYYGINSARRAEQNRVWVGMAKETAHQLGTPISAIIAWIEHLRSIREDDEEVYEVLDELENDVSRLNLIAERFSKIGSSPKLESIDLIEELEKCRAYMQRRAPRRVSFEFPHQNGNPVRANINPPLFDWVIENLIRNALDAMAGKGKISAKIYEDNDYISIDLIDTGKGIPPGKFKTIFQPGYTTKKRGWGLGLSLAKRIIEQYHSGKIFVRNSVEGAGTTFTIQLPKKVRSHPMNNYN